MDTKVIQGTGTASGTDNYEVKLSVSSSSYVPNGLYYILFTNANSGGASTININSIGIQDLLDSNGFPLSIDAIGAGSVQTLFYTGSAFLAMNIGVLGTLVAHDFKPGVTLNPSGSGNTAATSTLIDEMTITFTPKSATNLQVFDFRGSFSSDASGDEGGTIAIFLNSTTVPVDYTTANEYIFDNAEFPGSMGTRYEDTLPVQEHTASVRQWITNNDIIATENFRSFSRKEYQMN